MEILFNKNKINFKANKKDNYNSSANNSYNTVNSTNKESNNFNNNTPSYILPILIISVLGLLFIITIYKYKLFLKKNIEKKLKYFEYVDLGDRKSVRYKGNLLNSSINYKFLYNRKNILLFIVYKNGSSTNVKFSVSNYYIDIDTKN